MRNLFVVLVVALYNIAGASAQLRFGEDGTLKIVQFTDAHVREDRKDQMAKTVARLEWIIREEQPDVVIFTGDVVSGRPAVKGWRTLLDAVARTETPFVVVLGNHDREEDLTAAEIATIVSSYPNSLNTMLSGELDDIVVEVASSTNSDVAALLYCIDSNDYSSDAQYKGYGWIEEEQIEWYRTMSAHYTARNHDTPLPAYAFFHIPLPEYRTAYDDPRNIAYGIRKEEECAPTFNSGMFDAMKSCGDVVATFVGHDHNNNYVVPYQGIALCYGHFSGDQTVYNKLYSGVRVIELSEGDGSFSTWIRDYRPKYRNTLRDNLRFDRQSGTFFEQ